MKKKLVIFLKNNKVIYAIYYKLYMFFLKLAGLVIRPNKNEILFVCYGGRKYGDNVRPIYLQMLEDSRFDGWKFVWAFRSKKAFELPDRERTIAVRIDSLRYFYHALRAKCWVTNVSVQRGLLFRNERNLYVNTWHGVPLKRIGLSSKVKSSIHNEETYDLMLAEGTYDAEIYENELGLRPENIRVTGYPRNDVLLTGSAKRQEVRARYGVKEDETLILYAPTYRDYNVNDSGGFTFDSTLSCDAFRSALGSGYKMMVRSHGAIEDETASEGFINVSDYPDVEDLMLASDILVSDYSGIIFDYALLEKPIICYIYDHQKYEEERGFFVDLQSFLPFPKCEMEQALYEAIKAVDLEAGREAALAFQAQCGLIRRGAAVNAVNAIYDGLRDKKLIQA